MMTVDGSSNTSSTFFSNNCSYSGPPLITEIVAAVIVAVSFLLGIPANITVIVKLSRHLRGSLISQRLFFSLAVSDVLCLLCLPVAVVIYLNRPSLSHGLCQLFFYFFFFCITSDVNILVLISIQRYYQVVHPRKWEKLGRIWQRLLLFSVWMLGALVALPAVFLLTEVKNEDEWTDCRSCRNQRITPVLEAFYILFFVFCHLILFYFYKLLVTVHLTEMADKKKLSMNKLFIRIIAASLVVRFLPLVLRVVSLSVIFTESTKLSEVIPFGHMLIIVECFYFFNHCLNPFLYFFASRHQPGGGEESSSCS